MGAGAVDVTVDVPLASLPKVKVGQAATVTADGSSTPMAATVRSISLLPASSTTTSVSYPVVVRVAAPTPSLASGSTATATIILATVRNVVDRTELGADHAGERHRIRADDQGRQGHPHAGPHRSRGRDDHAGPVRPDRRPTGRDRRSVRAVADDDHDQPVRRADGHGRTHDEPGRRRRFRRGRRVRRGGGFRPGGGRPPPPSPEPGGARAGRPAERRLEGHRQGVVRVRPRRGPGPR